LAASDPWAVHATHVSAVDDVVVDERRHVHELDGSALDDG
jgi:hypothetical protein